MKTVKTVKDGLTVVLLLVVIVTIISVPAFPRRWGSVLREFGLGLGLIPVPEEIAQIVETESETIYDLGQLEEKTPRSRGNPFGFGTFQTIEAVIQNQKMLHRHLVLLKELTGSPRRLRITATEAFLRYRETPFELISAVDYVTVTVGGERTAVTEGFLGMLVDDLKRNNRVATFDYEVLATVDLNRLFVPGAVTFTGDTYIVRLPHAKVKYAHLRSVRVVALQQGLLVRLTEGGVATLEPQMIQEAHQLAIREAVYQGILQAAERSAADKLQELYAPFLEETGRELLVVFGEEVPLTTPDPTPTPLPQQE